MGDREQLGKPPVWHQQIQEGALAAAEMKFEAQAPQMSFERADFAFLLPLKERSSVTFQLQCSPQGLEDNQCSPPPRTLQRHASSH